MTMKLEDQIAILQAQHKGLALESQPLSPLAPDASKWKPVKPGDSCNFNAFRYRVAIQPVNCTVWINCCPENLYLFGSKQEAELASTHTRVALRKVTFQYIPGQFDKE